MEWEIWMRTITMMFLNFLNNNSVAFTVIFSALVAIATLVYAVLTWKLVSETRKMREAQTEPRISVTIQPKEEWINFFDMIIQNIGVGPAYNIKFKMDSDFEYEKGKFLSEFNFIKHGLRYLAPNQNFQFFLTSMAEDFENKIEKQFGIKVNYKNSFGKDFEDTYVIDFSELVGLTRLGEPPLYKIAKNIEKIQDDIRKVATGFYKTKSVVYTKGEIEEEDRQLLKQLYEKQEDKKGE